MSSEAPSKPAGQRQAAIGEGRKMSDGSKPTTDQKNWLETVFGPQLWRELLSLPHFEAALNESLGHARQIALRHLAEKERA